MKKIFFFTAIAFLSLSSCRKEGTTLAKGEVLTKSESQTNTSKDDFHINLQGVKGMGETTGNAYEVKDNISERKNISCDGCILTFSGSEIFKITSANANNNFIFKMKLIYTYNFCTLEQTVKRDVSSTECQ